MSKNSIHAHVDSPSIIVQSSQGLASAYDKSLEIAEDITHKSRVEILEPDDGKKSISIDQARELRRKLTLKSQDSGSRVVIIKYISAMGHEAQNSLLKLLEELGQNTTVIIPLARMSDALQTIRSRSRILSIDNKIVSKETDRAQYLIDSAMLNQHHNVVVGPLQLQEAKEFMSFSVADRLNRFINKAEDRDRINQLLQSLRVLCVATMRESKDLTVKKNWAKKSQIVMGLLDKSDASASPKLLLLGAATRL